MLLYTPFFGKKLNQKNMSFISQMIIEDDTMNVLSCNLSFQPEDDGVEKKFKKPKKGKLTVLIEANDKTDFLTWILSYDMTKNGEIIFYEQDDMSSLKTIKFKEGYCLNYDENFDALSNTPRTVELVIQSKEITVQDMKLMNGWIGIS